MDGLEMHHVHWLRKPIGVGRRFLTVATHVHVQLKSRSKDRVCTTSCVTLFGSPPALCDGRSVTSSGGTDSLRTLGDVGRNILARSLNGGVRPMLHENRPRELRARA